jgi:nickel/cobalt transporter (NiCoT) family protein
LDDSLREVLPPNVLVFPALFTAGMSVIDTADGGLMQGACSWAIHDSLQRLSYDPTITAVVAALVIGRVEAFALIGGTLGLHSGI